LYFSWFRYFRAFVIEFFKELFMTPIIDETVANEHVETVPPQDGLGLGWGAGRMLQ
jgi:hypothetical protein